MLEALEALEAFEKFFIKPICLIIFLILRFLVFATDVVLLDFLDVRSCYAICSLVLSL